MERRSFIAGSLAATLVPSISATAQPVKKQARCAVFRVFWGEQTPISFPETPISFPNNSDFYNKFIDNGIKFLEETQFELNDVLWRESAIRFIDDELTEPTLNRSIYQFSRVCDDRNNTDSMCAINDKALTALIIPTISVDYLKFDFTLS